MDNEPTIRTLGYDRGGRLLQKDVWGKLIVDGVDVGYDGKPKPTPEEETASIIALLIVVAVFVVIGAIGFFIAQQPSTVLLGKFLGVSAGIIFFGSIFAMTVSVCKKR